MGHIPQRPGLDIGLIDAVPLLKHLFRVKQVDRGRPQNAAPEQLNDRFNEVADILGACARIFFNLVNPIERFSGVFSFPKGESD